MSRHHETDFRSVILPFIIFTAIWGSTWIVIRDQLGVVSPYWSVAYRFAIAAIAMASLAHWHRQDLRLDRGGLAAAAFIGLSQFCLNFNTVYLAERFVTSGLVATFFALLLIPSTLFGWIFLGHRPTRRFLLSSVVAICGVALLFVHELREHSARSSEIIAGIGLTLASMIAAAAANTFQAREKVRRYPLFALLAWSMAIGAVIDSLLATFMAGPPTFESRPGYWAGLFYLALVASALAFSLYYPVVRKIGPGKAAYSSAIIPIIAMSLSTAFEGYRWTFLATAGVVLTLAGMLGALSRGRTAIAAPDAA